MSRRSVTIGSRSDGGRASSSGVRTRWTVREICRIIVPGGTLICAWDDSRLSVRLYETLSSLGWTYDGCLALLALPAVAHAVAARLALDLADERVEAEQVIARLDVDRSALASSATRRRAS
jgi:hypothetical protein